MMTAIFLHVKMRILSLYAILNGCLRLRALMGLELPGVKLQGI